MKRALGGGLLIALLSVPLSSFASLPAPKEGAPCSKFGISQTYKGNKFTCVKSRKNLLWSRGVAVKPSAPAPSLSTSANPSPIPTPTRSSLPSLTPAPSIAPSQSPARSPSPSTTTSSVPIPSTSSSPKQTSTPVPIPASTNVVAKAGDSCLASETSGKHIADGVIYCVPVSDGSYRYIEFYNQIPTISNPVTPNSLTDCEAPDLRSNIPPEYSSYAIAHDSSFLKSVKMKHMGTLNVVVEPIDFSDAEGLESPRSLYGKDFESLANWFDAYSNEKLKLKVTFQDRWHRASQPSSSYNVGGLQGAGKDLDVQQKIVQEFVNLSNNKDDFIQADLAVFVYPRTASSIIGWLDSWDVRVQVHSQEESFAVLSTFADAGKYEPYYEWMAHETLHRMGLAMHFPANPPGWGVEWGRYSYSEGLLPWNQMILDWLAPDQYYCVTAENISTSQITLIPQESSARGMRTIFIRVSTSEVLMAVSYRKDIWSFDAPDALYGTMVALLDTSKQNDWSSEETSNSDENFDGVKHQRVGIWLHPKNNVEDDMSWTNKHTGDWGALMYLGDVITYKGIQIKLVNSDNFDTLEISKS